MWQKIKNILELIVFKHSIFALPFLFSSIFVASKLVNNSLLFGWGVFFAGIFCAITARNYAMAMNRILDEDIDLPNPRCKNRPNIDGRIGKKLLIGFIIANALLFVLCSYFINVLAFKLSFLVILMLGVYSLFKRFSAFAHLFLGLCLGLAPIAGCVLVSGKIMLFSVFLGLGVSFWTAGFDMLYALQDMDYDRQNGLFSVPSRYGKENTLKIAAFSHVLAVLFWFCFSLSANLGLLAYIGIIISAFILFLEHKTVRKDFSKIDKAFFTMNGYLSIIFFLFIWASLWI